MSRQQQSFEVRVEAARLARRRDDPPQTPRGDDTRTKVGSYTKGLPHVINTGIIENPADYDTFVNAINTGKFADIRAIPLGPRAPKDKRFISGIAKGNDSVKFADVRAWESMAAGNAFDLQGPDAQSLAMPSHPALDSEELVAEMTEIYWMSLIRDIPFVQFDTNGKVGKAVEDMNETQWVKFSKNAPNTLSKAERARLRGPFKRDTIFRGILPGDDIGPYLSQFLLCGTSGIDGTDDPADGFITYGAHRIDQRVRYVEQEKDYMTTWASWLDVQNGADLRGRETYNKGYRFISTPRDLVTYVHYDALYQAYLNACIILLSLKVKFDEGIPFQADDDRDKQQGFALFGGPHILTLVTEVATRALKAVRYQKFNVHRRPRPERLAGLIERYHHEPKSDLYLPIASLYDGLDKNLLNRIARENGKQNKKYSDYGHPRSEDYDPRGQTGENRLLPMAFPEGSPMHPSYGAGHATVAGACVTILKAWFKTDEELPFVFEPSPDGSRLIERKGPKLTVEHELNKVCSNISIGRNWGGVHYFTDFIESVKLGEQIAIEMLEEQCLTYQEKFSMTLNKFDGISSITITNKKN